MRELASKDNQLVLAESFCIKKFKQQKKKHTNFSHHSEALLIVGATAADKYSDFMLLKWPLIVSNSSNNSLNKTYILVVTNLRQTGNKNLQTEENVSYYTTSLWRGKITKIQGINK